MVYVLINTTSQKDYQQKNCHFTFRKAIKLQRNISLNYDIEEFVPVCWFETTQTHSQTLYLLDDFILHIVFNILILLWFGQWYLQQAFLYKIIVVETAAHLLTSHLVVSSQLLKLTCLRALLIKHIWVEERADILVIALQTLQNQ